MRWHSLDGRIVPVMGGEGPDEEISAEGFFRLFRDPSPCIRPDHRFDVLCEGDSWFCLSIYGPSHVTAPQHLARVGYAVCNIAKYSRSSHEVQRRKSTPTGYLTKLRAKPAAFMVSMGGIDFLGETILSWLRQRTSGDHDPANAATYVTDQFDLLLKAVEANYKRLIADVQEISPETHLLLHGYAYAEPTHDVGLFLGQYFSERGFDPLNALHRPLIHAIIVEVIDRFYLLLAKLRRLDRARIHVVNFRRALAVGDFRDEIHPKPERAPVMAQAYADILSEIGVAPPSV